MVAACSPVMPSGERDVTTPPSNPTSTSMPVVTTTGAPAETNTSVPDVVMTGDLEIIVPPSEDGALPPDLMVGCRSGPYFPFSDLQTIGPLETADPGGIAEAITPFLEGDEGQVWPQDGWLILGEPTDTGLLVYRTADGDIAFMNVTHENGSWKWDGSQIGGPCPLFYGTPEGLNSVDWSLDPAAPAPGPNTTSLHVLATERECVDGREIGDRLLGPQVVMTDGEVRVAFAAQPPPGEFFTCPSNPDTPVTVELPQPLGERKVVEGLAIGISLEDYLD
jgi:hypothetical protein